MTARRRISTSEQLADAIRRRGHREAAEVLAERGTPALTPGALYTRLTGEHLDDVEPTVPVRAHKRRRHAQTPGDAQHR